MTSLLEDQILKSDRRGRVRVPVERREALLEEFERVGVSAAKFAEMVGLKYSTFANWAQKRRKERAGGKGLGKSEGAGKPI
jgi:transposase